MAVVRYLPCCGVGEVTNLTNRCSLKGILKQAKDHRKGMLTAYFLKKRGSNRFIAQKLMDRMLNHGFQKSGEPFVNPNTGNTIQPLHYILKVEEKHNTRINAGWGNEEFLDHPEA